MLLGSNTVTKVNDLEYMGSSKGGDSLEGRRSWALKVVGWAVLCTPI